MNQNSRTHNSIKNATVSVGMQLLTLVASFVSRTIFIHTLGDQYLGISGLYTNILSVLSLADLGVTTVMTFSLYKPIANHDTETVQALISYFKKLYRYIALAILALGLCFVPFLQFVIKGSVLPLKELRLYYLLFLANSVCSYLVVYKSTLITADQRVYIIKVVDFIARIVAEAVMIVLLLLTGNYLLYLIANVAVTLLKNLSLSLVADRIYPFLKNKNSVLLPPETKKALLDNIKSLFIYRVSAMIMNSTDNILISVILGTVIVGYYSNYLMIVTALNTFIMLVAQSVLSSIGSFNQTSDATQKMQFFRNSLFFFFIVGTVCVACFQTMFNDFIYIWIGKEQPSYILSNFDVSCISFNFFVGCILNPIWMYREATGIFKKTRYSMTCAALLNIVFSILFGRLFGLGGVIAATALAKLLTNFWYEPIVLYRDVFHHSLSNYWLYILRLIVTSAIGIALSIFACAAIPCSLGFMFLKICISFIITCCIFLLTAFKTPEFAFFKNLLKSIFRRKTA